VDGCLHVLLIAFSLTMNKLSCFRFIVLLGILTCASFFSSSSQAQEDLSVFKFWSYYGNNSSALYKHLSNTAFRQLESRRVAVANLKTADDWRKRQTEVRAKLSKIVGAFPEKTPLNPVVTGTIHQDDYSVEKLYFESRPGFYVTAAMFIPKSSAGRRPAILYCSGHAANGFRSSVYQRTIINYVKKGFVVLAIDPVGQGERIQYFDQNQNKIFGPTHEHSYPGAQSFVTGISPANYFVWDGIRAVDYLLTRKEVDPLRIGITGRSGGGTQATYIAAMDDRILASAPECYLTTFDKLFKSEGPQDAEQVMIDGIKEGIDLADYVQVRAPKPTLMITTTRDMFSIQGAREVFAESKKAFGVFGKAAHLNMVEDDDVHASTKKNREAAYAFFQKYLNNPGNSDDLDVAIFPDAELYATTSGNVYQTLKGENLFSLNKSAALRQVADLEKKRKSDPAFLKKLQQVVVTATGYQKPPASTEILFSGRHIREQYNIEKYLIKAAGDYYLPVLWFKPKTGNGKAVLLLDEKGKQLASHKGEIADKLALAGYEVILADLSGAGELTAQFKTGDSMIQNVSLNLWFTSILTHKSVVAVRAEEIGILSNFVKKTGTPKSLTVLAIGTFTSDVLHAAVIQHPFDQIVLVNPLTRYGAIAEEADYKTKFVTSTVAGATRSYDLPDLMSFLSPSRLLVVSPVNARDEKIDCRLADEVYGQVSEVFKKVGKQDHFKLSISDDDYSAAMIDWLGQK
jgi:dienelactone hydrolase